MVKTAGSQVIADTQVKTRRVSNLRRLRASLSVLALAFSFLPFGLAANAQVATPSGVAQVLNQSEPGSGFFVRLGSDVYFITARHVLGTSTKDVRIKLPGGDTINVTFADQLPLGEIDSALVLIKQVPATVLPFEAEPGTIANGTQLTVWGYPISNASIAVPLTQRQGQYLGEPSKQLDQGYSLLYSASTQVGFSGGPILNENGKVVGMHGRSESRVNADGEHIRTGNALGVPMKTILSSLGAVNSSGGVGTVDLRAAKALAARKSMEIAYQMISSDNLSNQVLDELGRAENGDVPKHCIEGARAYYYMYYSTLPDLTKARQSFTITTFKKGTPAEYYALAALALKKLASFDQSITFERLASKAGGADLMTYSERRLKQAFLDQLKTCTQ